MDLYKQEKKERSQIKKTSTKKLLYNIKNKYGSIGKSWAREELRARGVYKIKRKPKTLSYNEKINKAFF